MRRAAVLTVVLMLALGLTLALSADAQAASKKPATITGTIYCIDLNGKMLQKAGVCPAEHIGHVLITDDGRAIMLGGGEKAEKAVRDLAISAGAKVRVKGELSEELSAIELEELTMVGGAGGG